MCLNLLSLRYSLSIDNRQYLAESINWENILPLKGILPITLNSYPVASLKPDV